MPTLPIETLRAGVTIEVEITAISERGDGVAIIDARALHVPGLFPGDRAQVLVEALARHRPLAHGRLRTLLRASDHRREPPCAQHRDHAAPQARCTGCPLMGLTIQAQREAKRARIVEEHGLELGPEQLRVGPELGYRWSSKRLVAGKAGALVLGSRSTPVGKSTQSKRIADMSGCLVDHPLIVAVFEQLRAQADLLGIEPWRGGAGQHQGDLRYLWAKTNGEGVLLTLITGSEDSRAARELGPWAAALGEVVGVAWSVQSEGGNAIRGDAPRALGGAQTLVLQGSEEDLTIEVGPLGFLQPNPTLAAVAYQDMIRHDGGGRLALDLYAGAGATTHLLRQRFEKVVPCEAYPESAAALGVEPQSSEDFLTAWLARGEPTPELVLANPPRAGLGPQVCAALLELGAPNLHLMSCNPQTLAADLERLAPGYALVELLGYDTLPQTPHLELIARLRALEAE